MNKEVDKKEINKTIAEFEFGNDVWLEDELVEWGYGEGRYNYAKKLYTDSLDSLVPVWEKLRTAPMYYVDYLKPNWCRRDIPIYDGNWAFETTASGDMSIQHAAALATYKAIKEIKEKQND